MRIYRQTYSYQLRSAYNRKLRAALRRAQGDMGWVQTRKLYTKHKLRLIWELRNFSDVFDRWQHERMSKHIAWVNDPNEVTPNEGQLPPTPKQQMESISTWLKDHHPPFTEYAQVASRWSDDQMLHIKIPKGWTEDQKREVTWAFTALVNLPTGSSPPNFAESPQG